MYFRLSAFGLAIAGATSATFFVPKIAAAQETLVSAVQGADHRSPVVGGGVLTVSGVVTELFGDGFFLQSTAPDNDPATSEGLYVFLRNVAAFPAHDVGSLVTVTGRPVEFQPFTEGFPPSRTVVACGTIETSTVPSEDRKTYLTITELTDVTTMTVTGTAAVPAPVPLMPPGATASIAFADVPNTPFDPVKHPRDYFESLEGMRVSIDDALAVSARDNKVVYVAARANLQPGELTVDGLPISIPGHVFPEIMSVRLPAAQPTIVVDPGTRLGDLTGVVTYENGEYMVALDHVIDPASLTQPAAPEAPPAPVQGLRIATFNAENLDANDPESRFTRIAEQIVESLGAPDILALQEVQDDDGVDVTMTVTAGGTLAKLVAAIGAANGPAYEIAALDPQVPNADGGQPGGNIRNVYLVKRGAGVAVGSVERLFDTADRCEEGVNPFYQARKPLLATLTVNGTPYVLLNVHLSSKVGDQGLYSNAEDPVPQSSAARRAQAEAIVAELELRFGTNPPRIIILGDFNDVTEAATLAPFEASSLGLTMLLDSRGENYTFSSQFHGVREAIDHIVVGGSLPLADVTSITYLNLNADFRDQTSDHNPVVLTLN